MPKKSKKSYSAKLKSQAVLAELQDVTEQHLP